MHIISLIWGILAIIFMIIGFVPCLGALNWVIIPFAGVGIIIGAIAIAVSSQRTRSSAIAGLVLCTIALFFGIIRLILGGGVL